MASLTLELPDATISFSATGPPSAPPVVFIHGFTASRSCWAEVIPRFPRLRCYALDVRGHGGSSRTPGRYSVASMAADVEAFLEKVSGPAVVVGHSLGGGLGAMLASKRPDLVRALVIEDTNPWFDVSSEQDKHLIDGFRVMGRFIASAKRKGWTAEDIAAKTARAAYPRPGLGTKEEHMSPRMQLAVGEGFLAMDEEMFLQLDSGFGSLTPSGKVDVPGVLLIGNPKWGAAFPPGLEGDFAALAPRMRIAAFDNVGHEIHYCKGSAARFVEEVRKVIAEAYGKEWVEEVAKM